MKINISIDERLLKKMDNYIKDNYMSRSGFISLAVNQYLTQAEALECLKNISLAMKRIAETGEVDESALKQLEEFEIFSKVMFDSI